MAKKYLTLKETINKEWEDFKKIFTKKTILFPSIVIPFVIIFTQYAVSRDHSQPWCCQIIKFFPYFFDNAVIVFYTFILSFICVSMPIYFISKLLLLSDKVEESLSRIDSLSYFASFHTENNVFKKRLNSIELLEPAQRWILSKYISKLLSKSFGSFSIELSPLEYSKFSSMLFLECKGSIDLTGSMRPSTWLSLLVDKTDQQAINNKKSFFNNTLDYKEFPINSDNHSITLIDQCTHIPNGNKFRVVCLSKYDIDHLFISERSVDAYYHINDPEKIQYSYFKEYQKEYYSIMNPMEYEYALYDKTLLLKYKKEDDKRGVLKLINKNDIIDDKDRTELEEVLEFFEKAKKQSKLGYKEIKESIYKKKLSLLKDIITNKTLPHKLSYLYSGGRRWIEFVEKGNTKYSDLATFAIQDGLAYFKEDMIKQDSISIVEIGAGAGDRISTICDTLGSNNIESYKLLDISEYLLNQANKVLVERMPKFKDTDNKVLLDCCEEDNKASFLSVIRGKYVFIPNNSTLFTEKGFLLKELGVARGIFITLDMYSGTNETKETCETGKANETCETKEICETGKTKETGETKETCETGKANETCGNNTYNDHLEAKDLFLLPLKIFEIPIVESEINKHSNELFGSTYEDNKFNITFNLERYIGVLQTSQNKGHKEDVFGNIHNIKIDNIKEDYIEERKKLIDINELTVLSSLKFKEIKEIEKYFKEYFTVKTKICEKGGNKFVSIFLTPNNDSDNAKTDNI